MDIGSGSRGDWKMNIVAGDVARSISTKIQKTAFNIEGDLKHPKFPRLLREYRAFSMPFPKMN